MRWRLLAHLTLLPVCVWALVQVFSVSSSNAAIGIAIWLAAAAVLHDLVLFPLYSALDRGARLVLRGATVNYVRIPAGLSLLLLGVFFSTVAGKGTGAYHAASGRSFDGYATRWLVVTAALFVASGVIYLVRRGSSPRGGAGRRPPTRGGGQAGLS
ncbi:MAG TPA: hypothetical protein VFX51_04165 [Solirubrobacteraceae bacterium]|nr:hypothetical protein [Solirubrobacteraceae bacterium]